MATANKSGNLYLKLVPIMLSFFAMSFVDLVGTGTNFIKKDFGLSDTMAGLFPLMVFLWFLIFSVPTGLLMNRIGRRKTVLISLVVTALALLLPVLTIPMPHNTASFTIMLVSFCLLGIGNAIMQVSLNPLLSNIVHGDRLASALTLGQFVKAIGSFVAPIIAGWAALEFGNWKLLYPIFTGISILAVLSLGVTKIEEEDEKGEASTFRQCLALLGNGFVLLAFLGLVCHVGIDVGMNLTAPKILQERLGIGIEQAAYATSIYFLFRTIGSFAGAFLLARFAARPFFLVSVLMMIVALAGLFFTHDKTVISICIALFGLGNSNVFSVVFSQALLHMPDKKNEVSGLMIMGLFGGAVFALPMGMAADSLGSQAGALAVMMIGVLYLLFFTKKIRTNR